jgi:hypothetical protein
VKCFKKWFECFEFKCLKNGKDSTASKGSTVDIWEGMLAVMKLNGAYQILYTWVYLF